MITTPQQQQQQQFESQSEIEQLITQCKYKDAIDKLNTLINNNLTPNAHMFYLVARCYDREHNFNLSSQYYTKAITVNPNN